MKSEEYLLLMGNPFGSKAVRMLSSMEKKSVSYQFPKKIEEVTELIYKDPEKLDLMILMNNCDSFELKNPPLISFSKPLVCRKTSAY